MKKIVLSLLLVCLVVGASHAQCPMCNASLESSRAAGNHVGEGINNGILYLLVMPFLIVGSVLIYFYRRYKQGRFEA